MNSYYPFNSKQIISISPCEHQRQEYNLQISNETNYQSAQWNTQQVISVSPHSNLHKCQQSYITDYQAQLRHPYPWKSSEYKSVQLYPKNNTQFIC